MIKYNKIIITFITTKKFELNFFKKLLNTITFSSNFWNKSNFIKVEQLTSYNKNLKTKKKYISLLKSPHVNKTAWHQFQQTKFKHTISLKNLTYIQVKTLISLLYKTNPNLITLKINCIN